MNEKKVVVTGMGVISPIGLDLATFTENLKAGVSGEGPIRSFNPDPFPFKRAFQVKGFDPHKYRTHILDPFLQYAVAATTEAIADAGILPEKIDPYRIGISVSSSKGGMTTIEKFSERFKKTPSAILGARVYANMVPNFAAQWIARRWKIKGAAKCYVAACATGTVAIAEGMRMVRDGVVDYCIAGASDASIVPLMFAGYYNMKAMSRTEMRPFDVRRDGFLVGEGAGIVILETLENAKARRAKIYGEVTHYAYGSDGKDVLEFSDDENALAKVLEILMQRSDLTPSEVDYINLHGTATRAGDIYETSQIKKAFGKKAYAVPTSGIKSMTGHMLGASGAVEIIASLIAMKEDFIPPTIGLEKPDVQCDLDYTAQKAKNKKINTAISFSMGFGGHIAAVSLKKV